MNNISMSKGQERGNPLCVTRKKMNGLARKENLGKYIELPMIMEELLVFYLFQ